MVIITEDPRYLYEMHLVLLLYRNLDLYAPTLTLISSSFSFSSQQLRSYLGIEPDSPEERLGQLLMNPEFLTGNFDHDLWDPWEFFFFQALIDIDPKLPTRFFSVLAQEHSRTRFAKQKLADL
ncbi:hypothetical protein CMUST_03215 [Corynebacterium mustelae]|uniref:Uncharacterized protein n=1 Tax=Corynebacterium mustelae TaxID=571915 RepID=A0A0G3H1J5_9CORY|nr:hypothetical protein [Corynebacterium mustelae]AKK04987.1 hypothetical protein CMUST_03215 [Corynebacterium mustelae]